MKRGTLSLDRSQAGKADEASLHAELDAVARQLQVLGADAGVLKAHLEVVAERLGEAERQVWSDQVEFCRDPMNIRQAPSDPSTRRVILKETHIAGAGSAVMLSVAIDPRDLPRREDLFSAAQRYL